MSTLDLAATQALVQRHLLDPDCDPGNIIADTAKVPRATRLGIYANAYRARLVEAMSADFGALHSYLGDVDFERLIHAYLEVFPSRHFSLRPFGAQLSEFLRTTAPYAEHVELYELALFEWALCHAFDAADVPPLQAAALAAIAPDDWPALRLTFHPSLQCIELRGNITELWTALNSEQVPPALQFAEETRSHLVWRNDLKLLFRLAEPAEVQALQQFCAGANFGDVCELLAQWYDDEEVPMRALGLLQQWLREGLVTGL
jgi:hypothetical protein